MFYNFDNDPGRGFVKICGVTNLGDAKLCAELGADAVGILVLQPGAARKPNSVRLARREAAALANALPDGLQSVLLVHETEPDAILDLASVIRPRALQIQHPVDANILLRVKECFPELSIIKTFRVGDGAAFDALARDIQHHIDDNAIDAILLDSDKGGSGKVHDWELSRRLVTRFAGMPTILAGGLNAENVAAAGHTVRPYGVDVMSGVASSERKDRKDPDKLRAFINAWQGSSKR
jgi:phosphoribosylanthranilate isomerase